VQKAVRLGKYNFGYSLYSISETASVTDSFNPSFSDLTIYEINQ